MKKYDKVTPDGTRDLMFDECASQREVESALRALFLQRGFLEVKTPGFEFFDVFSSNAAYYPPESMYKLSDTKGRIIVVRPDSTIPLARMTATRLKSRSLPIRLFYAQQVYRQTPLFSGQSDETLQMGVELLGSSSYKSDVEMLNLAFSALKSLPVGEYKIELGHVGVFKRLLSKLDAPGELKEEILGAVLGKNLAALRPLLSGYEGQEAARLLESLPMLFGGEEVFQKARALFSGDEVLCEMVSYLEKICKELKEIGLSGQVMVDFGLVNLADYYSSILFRGYVDSAGEAVLSGGRYDTLLSDFGYAIPATGFAVNVDRLAQIAPDVFAPRPDALVFSLEGYHKAALLLQEELAGQGKITEFSLFESEEETKIYAKKKRIPLVYTVTDRVKEIKIDGE